MKGYLGKVLLVDLSSGEITPEEIDDKIYEKYMSGMGLGAYYLHKNIPEDADPLGPENILGFISGLLTGTGSLMTGRWMVVCKSPLTGGWGDANCGGTLSPFIKRCGYDAIFFKGISEKPVYLYIDDNGAELRDAAHVWGKDAVEAEDTLSNECKIKKNAVATIGKAGEKISLISGIVNDQGRIAARSGVGAVMGSKKLKALVLAGSKPIESHDPAKIKEISKEFSAKIKDQNLPGFMKGWVLPIMSKLMSMAKNASAMDGLMAAGIFKKWGTVFINTMGIPNGDSPVKNWKGSVKDFNRKYYKHLNPDLIIKKQTKVYSCYSCVMACGGICDIKDNKYGDFTHTHKPEYETCCSFGTLLMNKDMDAIYYINELLNRAGMDSISAGNTVAFALECYENGVLTQKDTDGLDLTWGNAEAIIELVKLMINRQGIGDILADGVKKGAEKIGEKAVPYGMHAGGQEPGMHDSRLDPMLGVHYSVEASPGKHTTGANLFYNGSHLWSYVSWAPEITKYPRKEDFDVSEINAIKAMANSCYKMIIDGAGGCWLAGTLGVQHWKIFDWLNATTGWEKSPDEYMEMGHRIQTTRQMFNVKHGIDPMSFKIVDRMSGKPPLEKGPLAGVSFDIENMMRKYWEVIGWDPATGAPTDEVKEKLELK
ncbi:MAG: aldehyde ferredoxin oxidoreductase family protein [Desulfobacterales bacterium]|jgi:aldehyde:ferredoxin oxidoreductase|nr:aldehyde ferredoxin oxidoreductase family protein [Desulfobacteraceae bacterium]MBT7085320.1 aldehyde ferredoxin oxidoreductase family protein [Desulfobacterales bacterium]MBT7698226.1 aldehyde ferredoxin oxidoreductase family protein [Desulfobacterales bacterium]